MAFHARILLGPDRVDVDVVGRIALAEGRLVLTHQQPGVDPEAVRAEGAAAFGRDVDVAVVGAEFEA